MLMHALIVKRVVIVLHQRIKLNVLLEHTITYWHKQMKLRVKIVPLARITRCLVRDNVNIV